MRREVEIDICPWSLLNIICLHSRGVIPVAILTTDDFNAAEVVSTILFAGASPLWTTLWMLTGMGTLTYSLFFRIQELDLDCSAIEASPTGKTYDKTCFQGSDSVIIVPCRP